MTVCATSSKTSAGRPLWGQSLNDEADLYAHLSETMSKSLAVHEAGKRRRAVADADRTLRDMEGTATPLRRVDPRRQCAVGAGRADVRRRCRNTTTLFGSPRQSLHRAATKGEIDVIDAHLKIGDVYKDGGVKQHPQALAEYQSGLQDCEAALAKHPRRLRSAAQQRKGVLPDRRAAEGANRRGSPRREPIIRRRSKFRTLSSRATQRRRSPAQKRLDSSPEIKPGRDLHPLGTAREGGREP